jgi:MFS family permease
VTEIRGTPQEGPALRAVPGGVWALGFVSLFMDVSSETIHAVLPLFLTTTLGASMVAVGWIEGLAEATASVTRVFSGTLSDFLGRRKPLLLLGYGLAAATKPIFPLARTVEAVLAARCLDRVGKGLRGAPRDALVADLTPPELRGAAFGLRQALDTVGAFLGPLLAALLLVATANAFRRVFWIAWAPALVSVAILWAAVRERSSERPPGEARLRLRPSELRRLGAPFAWILVAATLLTLARFSEAFLILRAESLGVPLAATPLVLVAMNLTYAGVSYPMGRLSDRIDRRRLLVAGSLVLALSDGVLALAKGPLGLLAGVLLWGLHMGMTQGLFAALVADASPPALRGTAFGFFHLASGAALLGASVLAGELWAHFGPAATFLAGAGVIVVALAVLGVAVRRARQRGGAPTPPA